MKINITLIISSRASTNWFNIFKSGKIKVFITRFRKQFFLRQIKLLKMSYFLSALPMLCILLFCQVIPGSIEHTSFNFPALTGLLENVIKVNMASARFSLRFLRVSGLHMLDSEGEIFFINFFGSSQRSVLKLELKFFRCNFSFLLLASIRK